MDDKQVFSEDSTRLKGKTAFQNKTEKRKHAKRESEKRKRGRRVGFARKRPRLSDARKMSIFLFWNAML